MEIKILCDAYWEAKIDKVLYALGETGYKNFFNEHSYGSSIDCILILLICQPVKLHLKQRIRFSKKEKRLGMDIMLDLEEFMLIDQSQRNRIAADKIIAEVPPIIEKYKLKDFDEAKFRNDLKKVFKRV